MGIAGRTLAALALGLALGSAGAATLSEELVARAGEKMQRGDLQGALADANLAIVRDARNAPAYAVRGTARMMLGNRRGALADLTQAIELAPEMKAMSIVYSNRANLHWLEGQPSAAAADLEKALQLNPELALAYNVRGRIKADSGDLDGARADYDRALQLEPKMMPAYAGRAAANLQAGRLQESIGDYKILMWSLPQDADVVAYHGIVRGLLGETEAAMNDLLRARLMNPLSVSEARTTAASPAKGLEQYALMNPDDARAHLVRAVLSFINGKPERGEQQLERAVQMDPKLAPDAALVRARK